MRLQIIVPALLVLTGFVFFSRASEGEPADVQDWCRVTKNIPVDVQSGTPPNQFDVHQQKLRGYIPEDTLIPCAPDRYKDFTGYPSISAIHTVGNIARPMVSAADQEFYWSSLNGRGTNYEGAPVEAFVNRAHVRTIPTYSIDDPCTKKSTNDSCQTISANGSSQFLKVRYFRNGTAAVYLHGQPMQMFLSDAVWDPSPSNSDFDNGKIYYKVDLVPNNKSAIQKYLNGHKTGVVWTYVDSFGLGAKVFDSKKSKIFVDEDTQTSALIDCCKAKRSPFSSFIDEVAHNLKERNTEPVQMMVDHNTCEESLSPYNLETTSMRIWEGRVNHYIHTAYHPIAMRTRSTAQDLANIDILARTLYGEMRSCEAPKYFRRAQIADSDKRYYYAVAAVILNRLHDCKSKQHHGYCNPGHENLAGIVSKRSQFSCWKPSDPNLRKIKCVAISRPRNRAAWDDAVKVASDAILNRAAFNKKLRGIPGIKQATYYYSPKTERRRPKYLRRKKRLPEPRQWDGGCLKLFADK